MSDFFPGIAWLIPFFPLLGAGVAVLGPRRMRTHAHIPVIAGIALAFLVSLGLLVAASSRKNGVRHELAFDQQLSTYPSSFGSTA